MEDKMKIQERIDLMNSARQERSVGTTECSEGGDQNDES